MISILNQKDELEIDNILIKRLRITTDNKLSEQQRKKESAKTDTIKMISDQHTNLHNAIIKIFEKSINEDMSGLKDISKIQEIIVERAHIINDNTLSDEQVKKEASKTKTITMIFKQYICQLNAIIRVRGNLICESMPDLKEMIEKQNILAERILIANDDTLSEQQIKEETVKTKDIIKTSKQYTRQLNDIARNSKWF